MSETSETAALPELFYEIAHAGSASARRLVVERDLLDKVRFRNLTYPEVRADFEARGGKALPALWDGARLWEGEEAVLEVLRRL